MRPYGPFHQRSTRSGHAWSASREGDRKSSPSLVMVSRDLAETLRVRYPNEPATREFLEELRTLAA
jgi:hypothetical protein